MKYIKLFEQYNTDNKMFITFDKPTIVVHVTSKDVADTIRQEGFKTGYEVNVAEKRKAIYFADKDVNYGMYARNSEGETYEGQEIGEVEVDIQGLKLLNMNYKEHNTYVNYKQYSGYVVRGELEMLPECDGSISFLEDGRIYEVALKKEVANGKLINKHE
jgi:hypothetical protein